MKLDNSIFWFGSESSLRHVIDSQEQMRGQSIDPEVDQDRSHLLSVAEGIGIIPVHGSLTNEDSPFNGLFGITSYNDIRNAIIDAVNDPDISRIVLDMDTPGGAAKGVSELSDFIGLAKQRKPIDTYVSGSAFSAGYWIASATDRISGPKMSEAGSIGVVSVLMSEARALKEEGIDVTVFRGGKFKALGNRFEELTDKAKEIYQGKMDAMEDFFLDAVAENRSIPRGVVKAQVGEGLTFFANEAVANGLMDEVVSFDEFFNRLVKQSNQGSAGGRTILSEDIDMKKKVLTAASVAAIAAGAAPEAVEDLLTEASDETGEVEAADPAAVVKDEAADPVAAKDEGEAADPTDVVEKAEASDTTGLVAYLKDELKTLRADNIKLSADLERFKDKAESASANETALKKIAGEYVASMSIGLGMATMNLEGMDTSMLLEQYKGVRTQFTTRFTVGSTAEVLEDEPASSGDGLSWMERQSVAANKL
jgi:signal peptide peptidase SppA